MLKKKYIFCIWRVSLTGLGQTLGNLTAQQRPAPSLSKVSHQYNLITQQSSGMYESKQSLGFLPVQYAENTGDQWPPFPFRKGLPWEEQEQMRWVTDAESSSGAATWPLRKEAATTADKKRPVRKALANRINSLMAMDVWSLNKEKASETTNSFILNPSCCFSWRWGIRSSLHLLHPHPTAFWGHSELQPLSAV